MIAAYVYEIIMFCAGAWMGAVCFGWLPGSETWREENCTLLTLNLRTPSQKPCCEVWI